MSKSFLYAKVDLYTNKGCKNQFKTHTKGEKYNYLIELSGFNKNVVSVNYGGGQPSIFNNEDCDKYFSFKPIKD